MKLLSLVERPIRKESFERDSVTNRIGLSLQFDSSCSLRQKLVDPSHKNSSTNPIVGNFSFEALLGAFYMSTKLPRLFFSGKVFPFSCTR